MPADRRDLRQMLRAGDPYDGAKLPAADATRIKARVRAAAGERPAPALNWTLAGVVTACTALVALVVWVAMPAPELQPDTSLAAPDPPPVSVSRPGAGTTSPALDLTTLSAAELVTDPRDERLEATRAAGLTAPAPAAAVSPSPPLARHVRMTAPRGTRIIWTLDPAFDNPDSTLNGADDRLQGADPR